jgi:hypothetical protein
MSPREAAAARAGNGMKINGNIDRFDGEICAGWVIDEDDPSRPLTVQIVINGVVVHTELANMERGDLRPIFGSADHGFAMGFSHYLKTGKNVVELVLVEGGFTFRDAVRAFDTRDLAEEGRDGFLFLRNDSNNTPDVIEGRRPLTPEATREIADHLIERFRMITETGARCMTIVLPEKSVLANSKRLTPLVVSDARPAIQLRDALAGRPVEIYDYAISVFDAFVDPAEACLKTDTHLTSAAFHHLFRYAMKRLGRAPAVGYSVAEPETFIGDLGIKLEPCRRETTRWRRPFFATREVIDEATPAIRQGTTLRGTRIYHESGADNSLTCLLIGTSSAYATREWFFANFRKVHFYWENAFDPGFLREARPDYVVFLANERYLSRGILNKDLELRPLALAEEPR